MKLVGKSWFLGLVLAPLLMLNGGCTSLHMARPNWSMSDRPHAGEVTQVMALWADGLVVHPDPMNNGAPTPGVAARVYLFGDDVQEALAADGTLSVHLYDDAQKPAAGDASVPREVWNLDEAALSKVLKKDGLGWGYNLWLPWSNYHPGIKKITLIVQYKAKERKESWSGHTTMLVGGDGGLKTASRIKTAHSADKAQKTEAKPPDEE